MSKRTADLPPLTGLPHLVREMRYSEFFRQAIGILLIPVYALLARPSPAAYMAGALIAVAGVLVRFYASGYIVKNKQLATSGPYSLVRHPLYTGNLLMIIGFTFACGQWWALIVSGVFWWFYYPVTIDYEDRKLHAIFGDEWAEWSKTVPAVVPRSLNIKSGGSWSFETSWKENYEAIIVVYALFWLGWIGRMVV